MDNSIHWAKEFTSQPVFRRPDYGMFNGETDTGEKRRGTQPEWFSINRPGDCCPAGAKMIESGRQLHRQRIDDILPAFQYGIDHSLVVRTHRIEHRGNIKAEAVQTVVEEIQT